MKEDKEQKKKIIEKVILRITIVLLFLFIVGVSLVTLASTIMHKENLSFGNYKFYIMRPDTQKEIAEQGDLVIVKQYKTNEAKAGDSVVYYSGENYYANKIQSIETKNEILHMATLEGNGVKYQIEESQLEGKVIKIIHNLGSFIKFLRTALGTILFILITICLFILLRAIFIRKKQEKSQEENIEPQTK